MGYQPRKYWARGSEVSGVGGEGELGLGLTGQLLSRIAKTQ